MYTTEELFALNIFLTQRDFLLDAERPTRVIGDYYIFRMEDGTDCMARKEVNGFTKMFQLESWKRFTWGKKRSELQRERRSANEC